VAGGSGCTKSRLLCRSESGRARETTRSVRAAPIMPLWGFFKGGRKKENSELDGDDSSDAENLNYLPVTATRVRRGAVDIRRPSSSMPRGRAEEEAAGGE